MGSTIVAATVEEYKKKMYENGRRDGEIAGEKLGRIAGVKEGRIAGVKEANMTIARGLKQSGVDLEIINRNTGLSIEEIMKL